ncbi:hypothetical protein HaLaN_14129, partial [Haematococcus lacustris]
RPRTLPSSCRCRCAI